jgi:hypothetical protein
LDPSGIQVLLGYADGVIRLFALESETDPSGASGKTVYLLTKALAAKNIAILYLTICCHILKEFYIK